MQIGRLAFAIVALGIVGAAAALYFGQGGDGPRRDGGPAPDTQTEPHAGPAAVVTPKGQGGTPPDRVVQDPVRQPIRDDFADLLRGHDGGAIAGLVVSDTGAPVQGALVVLVHPTDEDVLDQRTSDARGRFLFPVGIDSEEFESFRLAAQDPARGLSALQSVRKPQKGEITIVELHATLAFGSITGRVLGPGGRPVPDHPVMLVRTDPAQETFEWTYGRDDCEVRTGPDGSFVARGLRPGKFEIDASPREEPAGQLVRSAEDRPEAVTDGPLVTVELPWTRVDVIAVGRDDKEQSVNGFILHVFVEPLAQLAAQRFATGEALEGPDLVATANRSGSSGSRASFWVSPGCFVVAEIDDGPRHAREGAWVARDVAVQEIRVGKSAAADGRFAVHVRSDDGTAIREVFARITSTGQVPVVPVGAEDLGAGYVRVDPAKPFALAPSSYGVEILADPAWGSSRPLADEFLPATFEIAIAPAGSVEREVVFTHAARIEFEVQCDASNLKGAEPDRFAGRVGDVPIARLNGNLWRHDDILAPLLFAMPSPDDPKRYVEVAGVPWKPGETTHARVLTAVAPGAASLSVSSWRSATEDPEGAHWPVELVRGVNRFRLRLDADLVVHFLGR
ncbi:MAG: carboxypeptidase-like regulatory domain-containing protein [Planctomycetota bacterium]